MLTSFGEREWRYISDSLGLAINIHKNEKRENSGDPYVTHPIEIVEEYIQRTVIPHWKSILVLLLHDTLEAAPHRWWEVFQSVPIDIFIRILKLSKLKRKVRNEIFDFFNWLASHDMQVINILELLTEKSDERNIPLKYLHEHESASFLWLFSWYESHLDTHFSQMDEQKKEAELENLRQYLYFDRLDALHKWFDTMHNLKDVNDMPHSRKERYILRRIPKLNALILVMNRYRLFEEVILLKRRWQEIGWRFDQHGSIVLHDQVHVLLKDICERVATTTASGAPSVAVT